MIANAQTSPPPPAQSGPGQAAEMTKLQKLQAQAQQLETKLQQLAARAENENPELVEQRSELIEVFEQKLDEHGYPGPEAQRELQELQRRLQDPEGLDDARRLELMQKYQKKVGEMREAEQKARTDREFREQQRKLMEARSEAIEEIDPKAPEMEEELDELYAKLTELSRFDSQPVPGEP